MDNRFRAAFDAKLVENILQVVLHCGYGHMQILGDLGVGSAFCDEFKHLDLALGDDVRTGDSDVFLRIQIGFANRCGYL
jgi:hypothetical protein